jgi:hypothetical protein
MADEASVIDFAGIDTAVVNTPAVDTTPTVVDTPEVDAEVDTEVVDPTVDVKDTAKTDAAKPGKQQYNSDGSPKEEAAKDDLPGDEKTPQEIRKALKAFKDAAPENAAMVKQLHGAFERYSAFSKVFPKVADAERAKEFIDLIGGHEGYEKLTGTVQAAEASDGKLYDPEKNAELINDVVEDLKAQGKIGNLKTLTKSMLEASKTNLSKEEFYSVYAPHFLDGLREAKFGPVVGALSKVLSDPDPAKAIAAAKEIAADMKSFYDELENEQKAAKTEELSPERKKLNDERAAFLKQQEDFKTNQTKEFQNSVASVCEKANNTTLGADLGHYLKLPFFTGFTRANLTPLGNMIKTDLYATLKADSAYQTQMKAMWGAKTPDRAKIEEYHKARVASISADVVRNAVQRMYPGYNKGGAAAGRVAAAAVKKTEQAKVEQKAVATGQPIYVAQKPSRESLDMDHKDAKGKPDAIMNMIAGRGWLKGSNKYITWRK